MFGRKKASKMNAKNLSTEAAKESTSSSKQSSKCCSGKKSGSVKSCK